MQKFTNFSFFFYGCHREHSSAKCTLTEIAKILIEKILDEERESHSKKPRWAMHKMKADEKKDKQPTAWVCDMPPQNKDD